MKHEKLIEIFKWNKIDAHQYNYIFTFDKKKKYNYIWDRSIRFFCLWFFPRVTG